MLISIVHTQKLHMNNDVYIGYNLAIGKRKTPTVIRNVTTQIVIHEKNTKNTDIEYGLFRHGYLD